MLIQLIAHHPEAIGTILKSTPGWVWGLLAALLALGISQVRSREVSLARTAVMPVAMVGLSLWGMASAFGGSPQLGWMLLAWAACAAVMAGLIGSRPVPSGTQYHASRRSFHVPGSLLPLALILVIFLTKYVVGVDLAMQHTLALDGQYTLIVGALYGLASGIFAGRALRLWRLSRGSRTAMPAAAFNA